MAFTVLIADDDQRLPRELKRLLISQRCVSVVEARDGEEVLRLALAPETKIIMLTVHDETQYRKAARPSGADSYLLKKTLGAAAAAPRDFPAPPSRTSP